MKERPILFSAPMVRAILEGRKTQTRRVIKDCYLLGGPPTDELLKLCPYGQRGDRLWVREAFHICPHHEDYFYRADDENLPIKCKAHTKWRPSIHMPRAASRTLLEITGLRVERLQDISQADAIAEGVYAFNSQSKGLEGKPYYRSLFPPNKLFKQLWDSINGEDSWDANPWVWVIEFKKVEASS